MEVLGERLYLDLSFKNEFWSVNGANIDANFPDVNWVRPREIVQKEDFQNWFAFMNFCYPEIFDNLILENKNGLFRIQLFTGVITIDDQIPCDVLNVPLFCKSSIKAMMIEKAVAKFYGSYIDIK